MMDWWDIKLRIRELMTDFCLWLLQRVNRYCDRCLSQILFVLAERYNTRPGTFNYYSPDLVKMLRFARNDRILYCIH